MCSTETEKETERERKKKTRRWKICIVRFLHADLLVSLQPHAKQHNSLSILASNEFCCASFEMMITFPNPTDTLTRNEKKAKQKIKLFKLDLVRYYADCCQTKTPIQKKKNVKHTQTKPVWDGKYSLIEFVRSSIYFGQRDKLLKLFLVGNMNFANSVLHTSEC